MLGLMRGGLLRRFWMGDWVVFCLVGFVEQKWKQEGGEGRRIGVRMEAVRLRLALLDEGN